MASRSEIECLYNAPDSRTLDLTRQACIAGCRLQVNNGELRRQLLDRL